jgi:hypothetical protein
MDRNGPRGPRFAMTTVYFCLPRFLTMEDFVHYCIPSQLRLDPDGLNPDIMKESCVQTLHAGLCHLTGSHVGKKKTQKGVPPRIESRHRSPASLALILEHITQSQSALEGFLSLLIGLLFW